MKTPMLGILGGTFNPIHFGHLRMAEDLAQTLACDEVLFIPSATPPHKNQPEVSAQQRSKMVEIAITDNPKFKLDMRELKREGISYTIDTLKSLRQEKPKHSLCLLMGSDAFCKLDSWYEWSLLLDYCHIVMVQRPIESANVELSTALKVFLQANYTEDLEQLRQNTHGYVTMLKVSILDISSTQLRNLITNNKSIRYLLPTTVCDYIKVNQLYKFL